MSMEQHYQAAQACIPGGVNSPVRAYKSVGGTPVFVASAQGAQVTDIEGKTYVDYVLSYGPHILGHNDSRVVKALEEALKKGTSFGAPTLAETELAELLCEIVPSMDMVRLVNSGTEATMSAVRLARAATGRDHIIKYEGCYHGHADGFLVKAGSGALTLGAPDSPGVPAAYAELTALAPYNDLAATARLMEAEPGRYAAIIVEPVAGNIGCVPPEPGFLEGLRQLCDDHGTLLIFDEVMTGFRVAKGGAQELYGVTPDLTTLGKVIGGGLPIGAYGGRRELMAEMAPSGQTYQAGTLSGNPLAVAAGLAQLNAINEEGFYPELEEKTAAITNAIEEAAAAAKCPLQLQRVGSMFCPYFSSTPVKNLADAMGTDQAAHKRFFHALKENGVLPAPSAFEAWFSSIAHGPKELEVTQQALLRAFAAV